MPYPSYQEEVEEDYRGESDGAKSVVCRFCTKIVNEDDTIGENVCRGCAELHGLLACDGCGRVMAKGAAIPHHEIGELTGRTLTFNYCNPCHRDFVRRGANG